MPVLPHGEIKRARSQGSGSDSVGSVFLNALRNPFLTQQLPVDRELRPLTRTYSSEVLFLQCYISIEYELLDVSAH